MLAPYSNIEEVFGPRSTVIMPPMRSRILVDAQAIVAVQVLGKVRHNNGNMPGRRDHWIVPVVVTLARDATVRMRICHNL